MQPLLPEPAFDECSVTLTVLDLHCAMNVYPELCTLGFLQPSGLLKESWSSHLSCAHLDFAAFQSAHGKLGPRLLVLMVRRF